MFIKYKDYMCSRQGYLRKNRTMPLAPYAIILHLKGNLNEVGFYNGWNYRNGHGIGQTLPLSGLEGRGLRQG